MLGGFWHGASWTFILWGLLHGLYLAIDNGWRQLKATYHLHLEGFWHRIAAQALTLLAVIISWVIFRSENLAVAGAIFRGMFGLSGFILPDSYSEFHFLSSFGVSFISKSPLVNQKGIIKILLVFIIALAMPNVYQFMSQEQATLDVYKHLENKVQAWWLWYPTYEYSIITGAIFVFAAYYCDKPSEFLYFQF